MIDRGTGGSIISIGSIAGASALGRGNFRLQRGEGGRAPDDARAGDRVGGARHPRECAAAGADADAVGKRAGLMTRRPTPELVAHLLKGIPMDRLGEPEDIVGPAIFLASDAASLRHRSFAASRWRQPGAERRRQPPMVSARTRVLSRFCPVLRFACRPMGLPLPRPLPESSERGAKVNGLGDSARRFANARRSRRNLPPFDMGRVDTDRRGTEGGRPNRAQIHFSSEQAL